MVVRLRQIPKKNLLMIILETKTKMRRHKTKPMWKEMTHKVTMMAQMALMRVLKVKEMWSKEMAKELMVTAKLPKVMAKRLRMRNKSLKPMAKK